MTNSNISNLYSNLVNNFYNTSDNFAILKVAVNPNNDNLKNIYKNKIEAHNKSILDNKFADSGFDLFVPETTVFDRAVDTKFIDFQVKAEMVYCDVKNNVIRTCAFNIHPRSSISKTPLMLANHTGIIDSGYRGSLIGAFRCLKLNNTNEYVVDGHTRLVQVCHPTLCSIYVVMVDESELSTTQRGDGGFGSTGL
uniref:dUTPase-like domain-containing protein n=1 Tax=viral metagenome TaxID=1070528 RepID=A0A6C0JKN0_9ZZZZ